MPWKAPSGNIYQLILLDTNALSEIVKRPNEEGSVFMNQFDPNNYAPCFTVYNLIELRRKKKVYETFLDFFSIYPIFLLKTKVQILQEELNVYDTGEVISPLLNAFSRSGRNSSYELRHFIDDFFKNPTIASIERNWRKDESDILCEWLNDSNFKPNRNTTNKIDADRYFNQAGLQSLIRLFPKWTSEEIKNKRVPDLEQFPSLKVMLYSQYYRLFDPNWIRKIREECKSGEVTDIKIVAVVPYIDVIITEKRQADIFKKIKSKIPQLKNLRVVRISELAPPA